MIGDAGTRASPAIALASRERSPGRVRSTATTATHRSAPRVWVIMAAVPANSPAVKAAPQRGAPSSARDRPAAEAIEAPVGGQWGGAPGPSPRGKTGPAIGSSAARGREAGAGRARGGTRGAIAAPA